MLGIAIVMGYLYQGPPFRCVMHHHFPTVVSGHMLHEPSTPAKLLHLSVHHSGCVAYSMHQPKSKHGLIDPGLHIDCVGGATRGWGNLSALWHLALLQHAPST